MKLQVINAAEFSYGCSIVASCKNIFLCLQPLQGMDKLQGMGFFPYSKAKRSFGIYGFAIMVTFVLCVYVYSQIYYVNLTKVFCM